jgi:hypothetical protein
LKTAGVVLALAVATGAGAEPKRVTLMTSGDEAQAQAFTESLRELLARLDVALDVGPSDAGESAALAAVAADFSTPKECALTVVDDRGRVVMTRRLDQVGSPALLAEAAAHVVQSVIDDLRRPVQVHPPSPEEPRTPAVSAAPLVEAPVAAAKPEGRFGLELSAFAAGRLLGQFSGGGGISATFNVRVGPVRPGITLLALYQAPVTVTEPFVTVAIQTLSPRALVSLEAMRTPRFHVDVALGGGADVFFIGTAGMLGPMRLMHAPLYASPVLSAMVRGQLHVSSATSMFVGLGADLDLQPPNFVEREGMTTETVLAPWRVRPSLMLGFSFGALP